jgi:hypothetical protein
MIRLSLKVKSSASSNGFAKFGRYSRELLESGRQEEAPCPLGIKRQLSRGSGSGAKRPFLIVASISVSERDGGDRAGAADADGHFMG